MKRRSCLLLVAVVATIASAEPPAWRYYKNNYNGDPRTGGGVNRDPWTPVTSAAPPAYQAYSTINTGSQYTVQSHPAVQGPDGVVSAAPPGSYLSPQTLSSFGQQQHQVQQGPSQYEYQAPQQQSSPGSSAANLGFQIDSARGISQPSSAVPLPFGGMQSFYFSPKERALYQVMKIMLSPTQFNMIQEAMEKHPDGGSSLNGGYNQAAPVYGPPATTTTTTEAPLVQSSSIAVPPRRVPTRVVYSNRPTYSIKFKLRRYPGEECVVNAEPEPNEGENPRLRPLPIRSKRGVMRCTPVHAKPSQGFRAKERTVAADEDRNPLQPFNVPADLRPISGDLTQISEGGLASVFSNTNQESQNNLNSGNLGIQRGLRDIEGGSPARINNLRANQQQASQDSYLAASADNQGSLRSEYGAPKGYGPPKQEYGVPDDKLEADESGSANAAQERGNTGDGVLVDFEATGN